MGAAIDVEAERAATPGCASTFHLNNAGAALLSTPTLSTIVDHLRFESLRGGYEAADAVSARHEAVTSSAARLLGAGEGEVVVTGSDTQAWAKVLWGYALGGNIPAGGRMLTDRVAYDSHYLSLLQVAEHTGAVIGVVPSTPDGTLDVEALRAELATGDAVFCAVTHVPTHRGLVNPVERVGELCRSFEVPFFVDVCQSIGQLPLDVDAMGCSVATATGRKWLRGPRGTGLLFVRSDFAECMRPFGIGSASAVWSGPLSYQFRPGTQRFAEFEAPIALHLGLGTAIDHALDLGVDAIAERVGHLAETLRGDLASVDRVEVRDGGTLRSGIVTFTVDGTPPSEVVAAADDAGVNITWSEAPAALLDMTAPSPTSVVRASPHYYNTEAELSRLVDVVHRLTPG